MLFKKQLSALLTEPVDWVLSAPAHHIVNSVHVNWSWPELSLNYSWTWCPISDVTAADCSLTTDDKRLLWHHWLGRVQDYSAFSKWTWNWNLKLPSKYKRITAVGSRMYLRDKNPCRVLKYSSATAEAELITGDGGTVVMNDD